MRDSLQLTVAARYSEHVLLAMRLMTGAFLIVCLTARSDTVLSTLQLSHPVQSAQITKFNI